MPYKDPEKKKQWERKNRGKGTTKAIWWGYLYFDSAPENWEQLIRESGYEAVWAVHDKDVRPTGEVKETHAHVAVRFSHAVDLETAKAVLTSFGVKEASVQYRDNWRAVCRYMVHMDDPDKYQYDPRLCARPEGPIGSPLSSVRATSMRSLRRCRTGVMTPSTSGRAGVLRSSTTSCATRVRISRSGSWRSATTAPS